MEFTKAIEGADYLPGWVHFDICDRLEQFSRDVIARKSPRLMLLVPPRHGKSTLASQIFPAWHLGHHPEHEIINVGYNTDLPTRFSRRVREIIQMPEYTAVFPKTHLDTRSQAVEAWLTTKRGGFTAAGRGGGITGKGAHILIVDDPLKNMEEAENFEIREKLEDWYFAAAYTRLAPGGGVLLIETMWHDDDLAGRLLAKMDAHEDADRFEVIRYPAIAERFEYRHTKTREITRSEAPLDDEALELLRSPGEALHPERYDAPFLERVKNNAHPRIWSALYQQDPVPREGLFFQESLFHYVPAAPGYENRRFFIAWDFAISEKQRADYTVGVCLMQDEHDNLYVVDLRRFKGDMRRITDEFIDMAQRWGHFRGSAVWLGVEDGQIWKALKPVLQARMRETRTYISIEVLSSIKDKESRAKALQGRMEMRRFFLIESTPWVSELRREMMRFPAGRHDDMVDALSWAVRLATGKSPKKPPLAKRVKSWKDELYKYVDGTHFGGTHMGA